MKTPVVWFILILISIFLVVGMLGEGIK